MDMANKQAVDIKKIKELIKKALDENREDIIALGDAVMASPEIGYREEKTSALVRRVFDGLEIEYEYPLAVTGVKAKLFGKEHKYNVAIIGEMDALSCVGHPYANGSGLAHACGHNAQVAAMLGAAIAIKKSGVMNELDGDITFIAAPAEEFIDLDYRRSLRKDGKISYFGGKQELIAIGAFDDVDMAMMVHAKPNESGKKMYVRGHNLGFIAKTLTLKGKAAHGSTPHLGTNALNAAALTIIGIHSNRETFRDEERVRIHPIITKGGDVVNSVPDEVTIDTYVRGATFEGINKGDAAVERSLAGACQIIGAAYEIENVKGYLPIEENTELSSVFEENTKAVLGEDSLVFGEEITGSTDVGDLSAIIPTIQPSVGGFIGNLHSNKFEICDKETAYLAPALIMAYTACELLFAGADGARQVKANFKPRMTKQEYINYLKGE